MADTKAVIQEVSENKDRLSKGANLASRKKVAERALRCVLDEVKRFRDQRLRLENKWLLCYKLWDGTPLSKFVPSSRSVHVPEPYKAVEAGVPRIRKGLMGAAEWFRPTAAEGGSVENLENIAEILQSDLYEDKFEQKISTFIRGVLTYGDQPGKVYWKYKPRSITYNKIVGTKVDTNGPVIVGRESEITRGVEAVIVEEHPTLDVRDIYDFYTDASRYDLQDSPGNSEFFVRTVDHLRVMEAAGLYTNVQEFLDERSRKSEQDSGGDTPSGMYRQGYGDRRDDVIMGEGGKIASNEVNITERWGLFDPEGDGKYEEYVITLAEDYMVLQIRKNPNWHGLRPYVCGHGNRSNNRFYSKGLIEVIIRLSMELDDTRNMYSEANKLAIAPSFVASYDFPYTGNQLTSRSGQLFRAEPKSIEPLFVPDVSRAAMNMEATIKQDIQEATGAPSLFHGGAGEKGETATEVVSMSREANTRIEETAYNIGVFALSPMLEMFHSLDQDYITKAKEISVFGPDGLRRGVKKISPEQIAGQVRIDIITLPEISLVGLHAAQMSRFVGSMGELIQAAPGVVNIQELLKLAWVRMFGYKDTDKVFPKVNQGDDMTPLEENLALIAGHQDKVVVSPEDKDLMHLEVHKRFLDTGLFRSQEEGVQRLVAAHIQNHISQLDRKTNQAMPAQPAQMTEQAMALQAASAGGPRGGGGGGPRFSSAGPTSEIGAVRSNANTTGRLMGGS